MFNLYTPPCFAAIGGLIAVVAMIAVVVGLIINTNKKLKAEYALGGAKN